MAVTILNVDDMRIYQNDYGSKGVRTHLMHSKGANQGAETVNQASLMPVTYETQDNATASLRLKFYDDSVKPRMAMQTLQSDGVNRPYLRHRDKSEMYNYPVNTINRWVIWAKIPASFYSRHQYAGQAHDISWGVYMKDPGDYPANDRVAEQSTEYGDGKLYHSFIHPVKDVWAQYIVDWRPQRVRGGVSGMTKNLPAQEYPYAFKGSETERTTWNYFDCMTWWYFDHAKDDVYSAELGEEIFIGKIFAYRDKNQVAGKESVNWVSQVAGGYHPGTNELGVSWFVQRNDQPDSETYTVSIRYSFTDIHALTNGWDDATEITDAIALRNPGTDAYGGMSYSTADIDMSGQVDGNIYIGIRADGKDAPGNCRQIVIPLVDGALPPLPEA